MMSDYCVYALESQLSLSQEFAFDMLQILESEHEYVLECYAEGIVLEAGMLNDQKSATKEKTKTNLWETFKAFIKRIFGVFSNKSKALNTKYGEWLNTDGKTAITKNFKGVKMEVLNYKGFSFIQTEFNKIIRDLDSIKPTDPNGVKKIDDIINKYANASNNFVEGIKMYFRIGNPNGKIKYTTYKGNAINEQAKVFHSYCKSYDSTVVPWLQNEVNTVNKLIGDNNNAFVEKSLNESKEPVKDSFLMIEGCYNTQLPGLFNTSLLEAVGENTKDNDLSPKGGGVTTDETAPKPSENNETSAPDDTSALGQMKFKIMVAKNVMTAAMTICEEMFMVYIDKLEDLVGSKIPTPKK